MSKNISIKEGGTAKTMTVNKLKTDVVGGGICLWIPEDEVPIGTKNITHNGTYEASSDSLYGYKTITVNVTGGAGGATPGSSGTPGGIGSTIVGTDPVTGDDTAVTVNENGQLETTRLPSKIAVTTLPTKTEYTDGETINPSGIIVHAYYEDDSDYGTVQNLELAYDPIKADIGETNNEGTYTCDDFGQGPWPQPVKVYKGSFTTPIGSETGTHYELDDGVYIAFLTDSTDTARDMFFASASPGKTATTTWQYNTPWPRSVASALTNTYTKDGKTVYYNSNGTQQSGFTEETSYGVNHRVSGDTLNRAQAAWTVIYGTPVSDAGTQTITVKWQRPIDHKELTTTFDITVNPAQETEGEGEGGGGGHSF